MFFMTIYLMMPLPRRALCRVQLLICFCCQEHCEYDWLFGNMNRVLQHVHSVCNFFEFDNCLLSYFMSTHLHLGVVWDFYSFDCILGCCLGGMYFKTQVLVAFIMFTFSKKRS